jgi:hypothetical protein
MGFIFTLTPKQTRAVMYEVDRNSDGQASRKEIKRAFEYFMKNR